MRYKVDHLIYSTSDNLWNTFRVAIGLTERLMRLENADEIADTAKGIAESTLERAKIIVPDKADQIKIAMNDFAENTNLPFRL